mmetsp:Transcript_14554/g.25876  ORF Transcript_14554/g.25876 Transcript_14554/m.25876 type:complete len:776 (-) Transcript_14554:3975-6302(-)
MVVHSAAGGGNELTEEVISRLHVRFTRHAAQPLSADTSRTVTTQARRALAAVPETSHIIPEAVARHLVPGAGAVAVTQAMVLAALSLVAFSADVTGIPVPVATQRILETHEGSRCIAGGVAEGGVGTHTGGGNSQILSQLLRIAEGLAIVPVVPPVIVQAAVCVDVVGGQVGLGDHLGACGRADGTAHPFAGARASEGVAGSIATADQSVEDGAGILAQRTSVPVIAHALAGPLDAVQAVALATAYPAGGVRAVVLTVRPPPAVQAILAAFGGVPSVVTDAGAGACTVGAAELAGPVPGANGSIGAVQGATGARHVAIQPRPAEVAGALPVALLDQSSGAVDVDVALAVAVAQIGGTGGFHAWAGELARLTGIARLTITHGVDIELVTGALQTHTVAVAGLNERAGKQVRQRVGGARLLAVLATEHEVAGARPVAHARPVGLAARSRGVRPAQHVAGISNKRYALVGDPRAIITAAGAPHALWALVARRVGGAALARRAPEPGVAHTRDLVAILRRAVPVARAGAVAGPIRTRGGALHPSPALLAVGAAPPGVHAPVAVTLADRRASAFGARAMAAADVGRALEAPGALVLALLADVPGGAGALEGDVVAGALAVVSVAAVPRAVRRQLPGARLVAVGPVVAVAAEAAALAIPAGLAVADLVVGDDGVGAARAVPAALHAVLLRAPQVAGVPSVPGGGASGIHAPADGPELLVGEALAVGRATAGQAVVRGAGVLAGLALVAVVARAVADAQHARVAGAVAEAGVGDPPGALLAA